MDMKMLKNEMTMRMVRVILRPPARTSTVLPKLWETWAMPMFKMNAVLGLIYSEMDFSWRSRRCGTLRCQLRICSFLSILPLGSPACPIRTARKSMISAADWRRSYNGSLIKLPKYASKRGTDSRSCSSDWQSNNEFSQENCEDRVPHGWSKDAGRRAPCPSFPP